MVTIDINCSFARVDFQGSRGVLFLFRLQNLIKIASAIWKRFSQENRWQEYEIQ